MSAPVGDASALAEPMRSRWSPSVFDPDHHLDDEQVALLLNAARWAPTHGNTQPVRWIVAPRGSAAHGALVSTLSRGNSTWVPRAAVVFVSAVPARAAAAEPDADPRALDVDCYDAGQAAAHLTLQAQATGLRAHQFSGFDHDALATALGLPDDVRMLVGVAVGRWLPPEEEAAEATDDQALARDREREHRVRERRRVDEVAVGDRWGEAWVPAGVRGSSS